MRVKIMLAALAALTALAIAPLSQAAGAGVCAVNGDVTLAAPLNDVPRNSSYTFSQTTLNCVGTGDINGVWDVDANGNTSGIPALENQQGEGETCEHGQNAGPGSLSGTSGARSLSGNVAFTRVGSVVRANGTFTMTGGPGNGKSYQWQGEFQFTPDGTQALGCAPLVAGGVTTAQLTGVATVLTTE